MNEPSEASSEVVDRRNLRFTSLEVANWRNFTKFAVPLQQRMFLVGANAAGKSNFLDCFRFLSDLSSVGGGFEAAVQRRGGVGMLRSFAARRPPSVSVRVTLGNDQTPNEWGYELTFRQDNQGRPIVESETVLHRGEPILDRPDAADQADTELLRQTHLEQLNVNREFRAIPEFFSTVRYFHIVPQLVREPERSVGRVMDPFGGDFLEQIARTPKRTRDARFRRIVNALKVAVPQLDELELQTDARGVPHVRGRFQHWRPHGVWQTEDHFSDGTLRLLGLLWAVTESSGPLLLEEPELSLHPEVVRQIPQMFARVQRKSRRQILVSSHSVEIIDDPGIANDEVVILLPKSEGAAVDLLSSRADLVTMRDSGLGLGEILRSVTAPSGAGRLSSFGV